MSTYEKRIEFVIPPQKVKERLDAFLAREMPQSSRSQVQKLIKEGFVSVDDKIVKPKHIVTPHEKIVVRVPKPKPLDIQPEDIPLNVVYEDDHLLVINKPAGMVVHPAYGHSSGTLVNALLSHSSELSEVNDITRPGIVHRLDKDTSGLLVIAKNDVVHRELAVQFAEKTVDRIYHAFVWHKLEKSSGTVRTHIARSIRDRKIMAVSKIGKHAVTHYEAIEEFPFVTHIQLKLETGRTHQIRVHMSHIGHPVFGDQTYGGVGRQLGGISQRDIGWITEALERLSRQALHAKTLGFIHPVTQAKLHFTSDLPEDMQWLLERLKTIKKEKSR